MVRPHCTGLRANQMSKYIKFLLDAGADVNSRSTMGKTTPHIATSSTVAVVKLLIDRGSDIIAKGVSGETPLFDAVGHGREDMVKLLLDRGADVEIESNSGQTVVYYAEPGIKDIITSHFKQSSGYCNVRCEN